MQYRFIEVTLQWINKWLHKRIYKHNTIYNDSYALFVLDDKRQKLFLTNTKWNNTITSIANFSPDTCHIEQVLHVLFWNFILRSTLHNNFLDLPFTIIIWNRHAENLVKGVFKLTTPHNNIWLEYVI